MPQIYIILLKYTILRREKTFSSVYPRRFEPPTPAAVSWSPSSIEKWWVIGAVWKGEVSVFQDPSGASELLLRPAKYLYYVEMPNYATRGAAVMPAVPAAHI